MERIIRLLGFITFVMFFMLSIQTKETIYIVLTMLNIVIGYWYTRIYLKRK